MRGGCLLSTLCVGVDADRGWGLVSCAACGSRRTANTSRQGATAPRRSTIRRRVRRHVCSQTTPRASQATCTSARCASARTASTSRRAPRTNRFEYVPSSHPDPALVLPCHPRHPIKIVLPAALCFISVAMSLTITFLTDLGHRQETHPECV